MSISLLSSVPLQVCRERMLDHTSRHSGNMLFSEVMSFFTVSIKASGSVVLTSFPPKWTISTSGLGQLSLSWSSKGTSCCHDMPCTPFHQMRTESGCMPNCTPYSGEVALFSAQNTREWPHIHTFFISLGVLLPVNMLQYRVCINLDRLGHMKKCLMVLNLTWFQDLQSDVYHRRPDPNPDKPHLPSDLHLLLCENACLHWKRLALSWFETV